MSSGAAFAAQIIREARAAEVAEEQLARIRANGPDTCCYEYLDAEGNVLYVGVTVNPKRRWQEHTRAPLSQAWIGRVVEERQHWFQSRMEAEEEERRRVGETEGTAHNVQMSARSYSYFRERRGANRPRAANQHGDGRAPAP